MSKMKAGDWVMKYEESADREMAEEGVDVCVGGVGGGGGNERGREKGELSCL